MSPKLRVGVMISGRGSNMASILAAAEAQDCPYEVVLVASNNPEAPGLALADSKGVAIWAHDHRGLKRAEFDRLIDAAMRAANVEMIALAGYMRLLSPEFVDGWKGRILNIHPSLLPAFPGLHTHEQALAAGVAEHGCTVHFVTAGMDEGPTILQARVPVEPGDTAAALAARVLAEEHRIYPQALAMLARGEATFPA